MGDRIGKEDESEFATLYMQEEKIQAKHSHKSYTQAEIAKQYEKMDMQAIEYDNRKKNKKKTSTEDIAELQRRLVKCCIDFVNEKGVGDLEKIEFSVDELQYSAKYGDWTPQTDSFIEGYEYKLQEGTNYHYLTLKPFVNYC